MTEEYKRECIAIRAERNIKSSNITETLADLVVVGGVPEHVRSDIVPRRCQGEIWPQQPLETI